MSRVPPGFVEVKCLKCGGSCGVHPAELRITTVTECVNCQMGAGFDVKQVPGMVDPTKPLRDVGTTLEDIKQFGRKQPKVGGNPQAAPEDETPTAKPKKKRTWMKGKQ